MLVYWHHNGTPYNPLALTFNIHLLTSGITVRSTFSEIVKLAKMTGYLKLSCSLGISSQIHVNCDRIKWLFLKHP